MIYEVAKHDTDMHNALARNVWTSHSIQAESYWSKALTKPTRVPGSWLPVYQPAGRNFLLDGDRNYRRPMLCSALLTLLDQPDMQNVFLLNGDPGLETYVQDRFVELAENALFLRPDEEIRHETIPHGLVVIPARQFSNGTDLDTCIAQQVAGSYAVILNEVTLVPEEDQPLITLCQRWAEFPNITVGFSTAVSGVIPESLLQRCDCFVLFPDGMTERTFQRTLDTIGVPGMYQEAMENSHSIAEEHLFWPVPQRSVRGFHTIQYQRSRLMAGDPDIRQAFCLLFGHERNTVELTQMVQCCRERIYSCGSDWFHLRGGILGFLHDLIFFRG